MHIVNYYEPCVIDLICYTTIQLNYCQGPSNNRGSLNYCIAKIIKLTRRNSRQKLHAIIYVYLIWVSFQVSLSITIQFNLIPDEINALSER